MIVLGIHAGHDCGAAVVRDGVVVAAVNEERLTRDKLSFGVPRLSIDEALRVAGVSAAEVDLIALESIGVGGFFSNNGRPWFLKAWLTRGKSLLDFYLIRGGKLRIVNGLLAVLLNLAAMTSLPRLLLTDVGLWWHVRRKFGWRVPVTLVSHARAHLASAFLTSGERDGLSVCIEAFDGRSAVKIDLIENGVARPVAASPYPHSPGEFYALVTRILGFNLLIHCGKVTGLAAYGDPEVAYGEVAKLMWAEGMEVRVSPRIYSMLVDYAREKRVPAPFTGLSPADISAAFQKRLEDVLVEVIVRAVEHTGARKLFLSGGVVANVKLNQRIKEAVEPEFIYVHPGMSDVGSALGAALWASHLRGEAQSRRLPDAFLGTPIEDDAVRACLRANGLVFSEPEDIEAEVAGLLAEGRMVARVAGKMEYGPRALGNRSILYRCSDVGVNRWLNERLDRNEFMPFAPAVLAEEADRCFSGAAAAAYTAEFMTITMDATPWMAEACPAVVHVDGTARPQFVTATSNAGLHRILQVYHRLTGIPALVNTSYNIHNEPIVCTAEDAVRVFKLTAIDYLAIGGCLVSAAENGLVWTGEAQGDAPAMAECADGPA